MEFKAYKKFTINVRTGLFLLAGPFFLGACATNISEPRLQLESFDSRTGPVSAESGQRGDAIYEILVGEFAGRDGNFNSAAEHYANASELSDDIDVAEHAAKVALYARDFVAAERAIERWSTLAPESTAAGELSAVIATRKGDINKAFNILKSIVDSNTEDEAYRIVEKVIYSASEEESQFSLARMIHLQYPETLRAQRIFARLALRQSKFGLALAACEKAIAIDPTDTRSHLLKSQILLAAGDSKRALETMEVLLAQDPGNTDMRLEYARMLVQAREYDRGLSEFSRVLQKEPGNADVLYSVAILEYELDKKSQAIVHFQQLVGTESHSDEAHYYLGLLHKDDHEKAGNYFARVNGGEYYLESQVRVADHLAKSGQREEARQHLTRIRNVQQNDGLKVRLYMAETRLLREQQRYPEALALFTEALVQFPGNIDLLYARGMTGQQAGDLGVLERDLKAIIKQQPDNSMALNALGYTLADQTDRLYEAFELISKALSLNPEEPAIIDSMGWVLYRRGDLSGAEKYLRKAWSKMNDPEVASHLARVLIDLGARMEASETLKKALLVDPENTVLLELQRIINTEQPDS